MTAFRTSRFPSRCLPDRRGAIKKGGRDMPQVSTEALSRGILGVFAVSLMFSAAQIASGRDLSSASLVSTSQVSSSSAGIGMNRDAKADRAAVVSASAGRTRTISLRLDGLSDTSVLVRVPVAQAARETSFGKSGDRKLACEAVVSALTEISKRLEPGRCVT
jgi:hypothetical protein